MDNIRIHATNPVYYALATHDKNGNQLSSTSLSQITWTAGSLPASVKELQSGTTHTAVYDALGHAVESNATTKTLFLYGASGAKVAKLVGGTLTAAMVSLTGVFSSKRGVSKVALTMRIAGFDNEAVFVWFGSESEALKRESIMVYLPVDTAPTASRSDTCYSGALYIDFAQCAMNREPGGWPNSRQGSSHRGNGCPMSRF